MTRSRAAQTRSTWRSVISGKKGRAMTSSSAVIAKLMTMAVSTSACGSGSAYSASEATRLPSMIGDLLTATRPVTKMKTFTA